MELPIEAGSEAQYCRMLHGGLEELVRLSHGRKPELAIVVDGDDVYCKDSLASSSLINLSAAQCLERDMLVYNFLHERRIPQAWIMAGGYGDFSWEPAALFLKTLAGQS